MRRLTRGVLAVAILAVAGCADPATAPSDGTGIEVGDDFYKSNHATVFADEQVTWRWTGSNQHNVTFDDPSLGASPTQSSGTYVRTFAGAQSGGNFTYYCTVHGRQVMSGIITIR